MFACEAVGGVSEQALAAAVAIDLIHNFSLIHDDIQDGDRERRHRPTLWAIWGTPRALQAGNVMRTLADLSIQQLPRYKVAPEIAAMCSKLLTDAYLATVEGQYLDLAYEGQTDISTSNYLDMISRKTGALIRCSMQIGALTGNGDARTVQALAKCGQSLGALFQIRDDYLGIWGDQATTGKSAGNDIRRRKKSFPVVFALERANGRALEELFRIYGQEELEEDDVQRVLAVLDEVGAQANAQRLTEAAAAEALAALAPVSLPEWARAEAEELVEFLSRREF